MKSILIPLCVLASFGVSSVSSASIANVSKIEITASALNIEGWLQVSEVVATQTGTGLDVALASAGATANGSSDWPGSSPNYAIDGVQPAAFPQIFHSNENNHTSFLNIN